MPRRPVYVLLLALLSLLLFLFIIVFFFLFFFKGSCVLRFDLLNMLLTDMDVGKTVLGEESEVVTRWA